MGLSASGVAQAGKVAADIAPMNDVERVNRELSPRQRYLSLLWDQYRCKRYEQRKIGWDGKPAATRLETEQVATQSFVPPGFYADASNLPIRFRKPTVPYALVKVIVDRFTGLLFSENRHPKVKVHGDPLTEDYLQALADETRLWSCMGKARKYGGVMGTSVMSFRFQVGHPVLEVHDPRWIIPTFEDRFDLRLSSIEKKYPFAQEERDPATGEWVKRWYWYRRILDQETDTLFQPQRVDKEGMPWVVLSTSPHNFGFCPAQWIQNEPVEDEIDGETDCSGVYEMSDAIDALLSQAYQAVIATCDPMLNINTDAVLENVKRGVDNALKLSKGDSAQYLEISGVGITAAREFANELRAYALETALCVIDDPEASGNRTTATEVRRKYEAMIAKASVLREQYTEHGIKPLLQKMLRAIIKLGKGVEDPVSGKLIKHYIIVPPRYEEQKGQPVKVTQRMLGETAESPSLELQWPPYWEPTAEEGERTVKTAAGALSAGLIDREHATASVAPYFQVEDVAEMLRAIEMEQAGQGLEAMTGQLGSDDIEVVFTQQEIDSGLVTVDEWRMWKKQRPWGEPDGNLSIPAFKAKYATTFLAATAAVNPNVAAQLMQSEPTPDIPIGTQPMPEEGGEPVRAGEVGEGVVA